jgi:type IV secretion system protein VirB9
MRIQQLIIILLIGLYGISCTTCTTIDVERKKIKEIEANNKKLGKNVPVVIIPRDKVMEETREALDRNTNVVVVKDPVFIPVDGQGNPVERNTQSEVVRGAMQDALVTPKNTIGGTQIYDFNEHRQYPVVTRLLSLTVIQLQQGEIPIGTPYLSDTLRWELAGDVWARDNGTQTQLIMIKPLEIGLNTNMIIITNKRVYQIILSSTRDMYMPMVKFRYPFEAPFISIGSPQERKPEEAGSGEEPGSTSEFLAYNYKIKAGFLGWGWGKPEWAPIEAWDDGHKTYIRLPRMVLQKDYPVVFEKRRYIVNYRIYHEVMELDKLVTDVTLRLGRKKVRIIKRRGEPEDIRNYMKNPIEIIEEEEMLPTPILYRIEGNAVWAPRKVIEDNGETIIMFNDELIEDEDILIIDGDNIPVEYVKRGNMILIDHVIDTIQMAYHGEAVTVIKITKE